VAAASLMTPHPRILLFFAIALSAARAVADEPRTCLAGEAWDAGMNMCMPVIGPPAAMGHHHHHDGMSNDQMMEMMISPDRCDPDAGYYGFGMSMCLVRPSQRGRGYFMVMGSAFLADVNTGGARGRSEISGPNWLMLDGAIDLASWNRLELDAMLTAELWTTPSRGYPELLQIGESDSQGRPFIDAQHPHSSPLMGLALSDVISFSRERTRLLRIWFAPRGESTDGPIAFMHRPTGAVNPDAPLGHHIGQDAGHVTSTVIGAALVLGGTTIETSAFHGREPEPTQVDLPIGTPDSVGARLSQRLGPHFLAAGSFAYVNNPEGEPGSPHELRFSVSAYTVHDLPRAWRVHSTAVWGAVTDYDHTPLLQSILGEVLFSDGDNSPWSRLEVLQRTASELGIASLVPDEARWCGALTLGYTRKVVDIGPIDFSLGGSATVTFLPSDFVPAYGSSAVLSGKLFIQARGMKMWFF
jgi:hypothetical protein